MKRGEKREKKRLGVVFFAFSSGELVDRIIIFHQKRFGEKVSKIINAESALFCMFFEIICLSKEDHRNMLAFANSLVPQIGSFIGLWKSKFLLISLQLQQFFSKSNRVFLKKLNFSFHASSPNSSDSSYFRTKPVLSNENFRLSLQIVLIK